jgi:hypothetical protein
MKLIFSSFSDTGNYGKERIILKALNDINVGDYLLLVSDKVDNSPTSGKKESYWFPDKEVKQGDLVVLYTKRGDSSEKKLKSGKTAHFFYWGLRDSIWEDEDNVAVILNAPNWNHKSPYED